MENFISEMLNKALLENEEAIATLLEQFSNKAKEFILRGCPTPEQKIREYFFKNYSDSTRGVIKIIPVLKLNEDGLLSPYFEVTRICVGYMSPKNFFKRRKSLNDNFFEDSYCIYSYSEENSITVYYLSKTTKAAENIINFETK